MYINKQNAYALIKMYGVTGDNIFHHTDAIYYADDKHLRDLYFGLIISLYNKCKD